MGLADDGDDDDDNDDNDDDYDDDIELGDWRAFRMNLAETGIKTPEEMKAASDEVPTSSKKDKLETTNTSKRPKSVSKRNEELLQNQNEKLAEEYLKGVWAHEVAEPEIGGLVCRLPIEAEIWRSKKSNAIGRKLRKEMSSDEDSEKKKSALDLTAKTALWYKGASNLVKNELKLLEDLSEDGVVDADLLTPEGLEIAEIFNDNMVSEKRRRSLLDWILVSQNLIIYHRKNGKKCV